MPSLKLLLVEDDRIVRVPVRDALEEAGYLVTECDDGTLAQRMLSSERFDLVLSDIRLPGVDGLTLFRQARALQPAPAVVLMTAFAETEQAVTAMREGVRDYIVKPFEMDELLLRLGAVRDEVQFQLRVGKARAEGATGLEHEFVGKSPAIRLVRERIAAAASSEVTVLLMGEPGTGKDLAARLIHQHGARASHPFVAVNCAAIPEGQFEAEMFGVVAGAGTPRARTGRFEAADGGTLFIDEIDALSLASQARLMRALESSRIEPVGGSSPQPTDVRVIAAADINLADAVAAQTFRSELFYFLKVIDIHVPALRERRADIPQLVARFLSDIARRQNRPLQALAPEAAAALATHDYPGNVRELLHGLERAVALSRGGVITPEHLPIEITRHPAPHSDTDVRPLAEAVEQFERHYIARALEQADGHRGRAASLLGISRKSLWERLREVQGEERLKSKQEPGRA